MSPSSPWLPSDLPGLKLWLAGNRSPFTLNSGNVSQWNDISGGSNHATQGTASLQPAYVSSGINGIPGVLSDETDDLLETTAAFNSDNIFASTQKTIFVVYKSGGSAVSNKRIAIGPTSGDSSVWGHFIAVSNAINWKYRTAVPATATLVGPTMDTDATYVLAFRHDNSSVKGYANSLTAAASASDGQTSGETSTAKFNINFKTGGTVAEVIVCSALTDAQLAQTMNYLANKYGVTLS